MCGDFRKMLSSFVLVCFSVISMVSGQCMNCANRFRFARFPNNFNFAPTFLNHPYRVQYSSYVNQKPRVLNSFGQDASEFGSAIGKSIAERINQERINSQIAQLALLQFKSQPTQSFPSPTYPTTPPLPSTQSTPDFTQPSPTLTTFTSHQTSSPPEDLPTVQQSLGLTTPPMRSNYGSLTPGMLPPPSVGQIGYDPIRKLDLASCVYCQKGGYRKKRDKKE